uniref:Uncharacterized protein n=1 Tax=Aegilops tauschii subsp. strangulata TaxID=200361 RepID=A0A453N320_AEGTS
SVGDTLAVREILQFFGRASGLRVNFQKSTATAIQCDAEVIGLAVATLDARLRNSASPTWESLSPFDARPPPSSNPSSTKLPGSCP